MPGDVHADPLRDDFRDFLQRHAPLLDLLLAWTIRFVVPPHLGGAPETLQKNAWGQLVSPLKEPILTELRWYFERRASGLSGLSTTADRTRFERCERAFATDRHVVLYRCWRQDAAQASANGRVVADRREGAGVRRRENRAAAVASCLQPSRADGRRRLRP